MPVSVMACFWNVGNLPEIISDYICVGARSAMGKEYVPHVRWHLMKIAQTLKWRQLDALVLDLTQSSTVSHHIHSIIVQHHMYLL